MAPSSLIIDFDAAREAMAEIYDSRYHDAMMRPQFNLAFIEGVQFAYQQARIEEARRENSQKNNHLPKMRYRDTDRVG